MAKSRSLYRVLEFCHLCWPSFTAGSGENMSKHSALTNYCWGWLINTISSPCLKKTC